MINNANKYKISAIFSQEENVKYAIPKYQREYIWAKDDWEALLNDILESDGSHFIGSIICIKKEGIDTFQTQELEVVDGQQRLTTISLLFCSIYKLLKGKIENSDEELQNELFNLKYKIIQRRNQADLKMQLSEQNSNFSDYKFIIAGRSGWKKENVFQRVKDLHLEEKTKFIGFVEDQDLPYLYNAANLTVYLSSYEGFGLPPLESLACGTKVIVGDNSSLRETINKEFLVDLSDKNKILEKMKYLLENKIEINSKMIKEKFAWKNSAEKFLNIINSKS